MELAVLGGLVGLSYLLSSMDKQQRRIAVVDRGTRVSSRGDTVYSAGNCDGNVYTSTLTKRVRTTEEVAAARAASKTSRLASKSASKDADPPLWHNNMQPFFRGDPKSTDAQLSANKLEQFAAGDASKVPKKEIEPMFLPSRDFAYVDGTPNATAFAQERVHVSGRAANTLPFEQIRVGVGLGKTAADNVPSGGFQQADTAVFARPKNIDELRPGNNPKALFEGRIIHGIREVARAEPTPFNKQLPERVYDASCVRPVMASASDVAGPRMPGQVFVKETSRTATDNNAHFAPAHDAVAPTQDQTVRYAERGGPVRNKALLDAGNMGSPTFVPDLVQDDFGKSGAHAEYVNIMGNTIDDVPDPSPLGIVGAAIQALTVPIADALPYTRKDALSEAVRDVGNMSIQFPSKLPVVDPNNTARTTIKETLIHDSILGNIKGPEQIVAYYDPETVRTTVRETVPNADYPVLSVAIPRGNVKNPDDVARKTTKETTVSDTVQANVRTIPGRPGAYTEVPRYARTTHKEVQAEHFAGAERPDASGYDGPTAPWTSDRPNSTLRSTLADVNALGPAQSTRYKAQTSYDGKLSFETTAFKESTLLSRAPTSTGAKTYYHNDSTSVTRDRQPMAESGVQRVNVPNKGYNQVLPAQSVETHTYDQTAEARLFGNISAKATQSAGNTFVQPAFAG